MPRGLVMQSGFLAAFVSEVCCYSFRTLILLSHRIETKNQIFLKRWGRIAGIVPGILSAVVLLCLCFTVVVVFLSPSLGVLFQNLSLVRL